MFLISLSNTLSRCHYSNRNNGWNSPVRGSLSGLATRCPTTPPLLTATNSMPSEHKCDSH